MSSLLLTARSKDRGRWATSRTPSRVLAHHFGVSESRARHRRLDGDECVSQTCALVADPECDGAAIVAAVMEAYEDAGIALARLDRERVHARLLHLTREQEHKDEARQNRALMLGEGVNDAALSHARTLIELVACRRALGLEEI